MSKSTELLRAINPVSEKEDTMDASSVEAAVNKKLGTNIDFKLSIDFDPNRPRGKVKITSKELKGEAGLMSRLFSSLKLEDFGSGVNSDGNIWFVLNLGWTFVDGGSNGAEVLRCMYNPSTKKWDFK